MPHDGFIQAHLTVDFLGLGFSPLTQEQALSTVAARALGGGSLAYVALADAGQVAALEDDPAAQARLYADAWLTLNGSRALEMAAAASGLSLPRICAVELCDALLSQIINPDEAVCIVGADAMTVATIAARYKLNNVRWKALSRSYAESAVALNEAAAFVAKTRARYTFLCVGAPQQEMIARSAQRRGDAIGVALCVGDALTRLSGLAQEAPAWARRFGLERLYARVGEPVAACWRAVKDAVRIAPVYYYWLLAQLAERASISARNAF